MDAVTNSESTEKEFKYSDESSLEKHFPRIEAIEWAWETDYGEDEDDDEENDEDDDDEKVDDEEANSDSKPVPSNAEIVGSNSPTISKDDIAIYGEINVGVVKPEEYREGHCVTEAGRKIYEWIETECEKRDQDMRGMHIYNDWNGWGIKEVLENVLKAFNKITFNKAISPLQKWSYVEGLVTYLKVGDTIQFIGNEDGDGCREVIDMFIPMYMTSLEILAEHDLIKKPNTPVFNLNTITLLLLNFLQNDANDFDLENVEMIVRAADKAGAVIRVKPDLIPVEEDDITNFREQYEERDAEAISEYLGGVTEYEEFLEKQWDWNTLYAKFRKNHKGGKHYDISRMGRSERRQYQY